MEISDIASQATSQAQSSRKGLADDFDTFLTLLTAQLQHQDPLSPMETNDFMDQLAQFSAVEQSIQTNENLENLISLTQDSATSAAVSYIGKQVNLNTNTAGLSNGQAQWTYSLGASAAATELSVIDASGKIVYQQPGQTFLGTHTFTWDGTNQFGQQLPDGKYSLVINATTASGTNVPKTISVAGRVTGVSTDEKEPKLIVDGASYSLTDIISIKEAPPPTGS